MDERIEHLWSLQEETRKVCLEEAIREIRRLEVENARARAEANRVTRQLNKARRILARTRVHYRVAQERAHSPLSVAARIGKLNSAMKAATSMLRATDREDHVGTLRDADRPSKATRDAIAAIWARSGYLSMRRMIAVIGHQRWLGWTPNNEWNVVKRKWKRAADTSSILGSSIRSFSAPEEDPC